MKYKNKNGVIVENCYVGIYENIPVMIFNYEKDDIPQVMNRQEFLEEFTPIYPSEHIDECFDEKQEYTKDVEIILKQAKVQVEKGEVNLNLRLDNASQVIKGLQHMGFQVSVEGINIQLK